ncbi:PQQ-binding-like beta-propeller repeat protein [Natrononativus amylolyticus]|uniref:outer membrane protein assembly factor BamB family protein n=1 Tax=Natrononativus amylolyticus TaxID=2963434 RepID=UPI0020CF5CF5|nr:PQQ-binding-like beta-propeller repeat protein [Natrononativus amylolyticus]
MNRMLQNPIDHLEDVEVILEGPYTEKPGDSEIEQFDTDQIPETEITDEDLHETGTRTDNWLIMGGSYDSQRRYPGTELTPENVGDLEIEYQFEYGDPPRTSYQNSPLIVHGDPPIMYLTFGPDELHALNARTGEFLWTHIYEPVVGTSPESAPAERGAAVCGDLVFKSTLDLGVLAIDRYTGEEVWYYNGACAYRNEPAENLMHEELQWERSRGTTSSFPPLIYNGTLMKGSFGGEYGVSGFFDGISLEGEPKWRVNMTPQSEWVGDSWKHGGGTAWASGCIDVENDLVIIPSANAGPWYGTVRPGWNPYSAGKVAVDTETGEYRWHHQDAPHDYWDYDSPSPAITYTADVDGESRRLVSWAPKAGWVFTIDAETGRLVQRSDGYVQHHNMWTLPGKDEVEKMPFMMPAWIGGTNPQPSSYHSESRTMVVTGENTPWRWAWEEAWYEPGESFHGIGEIETTEYLEEWNGFSGVVAGVDPVSGEVKWQDWRDDVVRGGTLTTAAGVSFAGTRGGEFLAYATETGEQLWCDDIGGEVDGSPVVWHDPAAGKVFVFVSTQQSGIVTAYSLEV